MGSNFRGSRSRSSVYTATFIQDRDCDLDRDPVFLLRVNGASVSKPGIIRVSVLKYEIRSLGLSLHYKSGVLNEIVDTHHLLSTKDISFIHI